MDYEHEHMDWSDSASSAFDIVAGEFVVVTPDDSDLAAYEPLSSLLRRVRKAFGIEVAFIAERAAGATVVRRSTFGDGLEPAASDVLHATYGRRLLESAAARAPAVGEAVQFEAVPVVTSEGFEYGTLSCRRIVAQGSGNDAPNAKALTSVAQLIADWFDEADLSLSGLMPLRGDSIMGGLPALAW